MTPAVRMKFHFVTQSALLTDKALIGCLCVKTKKNPKPYLRPFGIITGAVRYRSRYWCRDIANFVDIELFLVLQFLDFSY